MPTLLVDSAEGYPGTGRKMRHPPVPHLLAAGAYALSVLITCSSGAAEPRRDSERLAGNKKPSEPARVFSTEPASRPTTQAAADLAMSLQGKWLSGVSFESLQRGSRGLKYAGFTVGRNSRFSLPADVESSRAAARGSVATKKGALSVAFLRDRTGGVIGIVEANTVLPRKTGPSAKAKAELEALGFAVLKIVRGYQVAYWRNDAQLSQASLVMKKPDFISGTLSPRHALELLERSSADTARAADKRGSPGGTTLPAGAIISATTADIPARFINGAPGGPPNQNTNTDGQHGKHEKGEDPEEGDTGGDADGGAAGGGGGAPGLPRMPGDEDRVATFGPGDAYMAEAQCQIGEPGLEMQVEADACVEDGQGAVITCSRFYYCSSCSYNSPGLFCKDGYAETSRVSCDDVIDANPEPYDVGKFNPKHIGATSSFTVEAPGVSCGDGALSPDKDGRFVRNNAAWKGNCFTNIPDDDSGETLALQACASLCRGLAPFETITCAKGS